jgi:hypothetical protein
VDPFTIAFAIAMIGSGIAQGQDQRRRQQNAQRRQDVAQRLALDQSATEQRRANERMSALNGQVPDTRILDREAAMPTLLTGAAGVDAGKLKLGKRSLLGAQSEMAA